MFQRGAMSQNSLCVFCIIAFLQTGISSSSVNISQSQEGNRLNVTCVLSGKENLTQVNWEKLQDSNCTKMGIFHPQFGIYIQPEQGSRVKIEGKQFPQVYSSFSMEMEAFNFSEQICCVFMTFPSGNLRQCIKISASEIINPKSPKAEAQGADNGMGVLGHLGAVILGSIFSLSSLIILAYLCHRCCCKRRKVFHVQQACHTDPSASTETQTEDTSQVQNASLGFDPAKLYAKIKEDLYYGRLWKSYQGRARVPVQGSPSPPRQIYYRLGESPLPQKEEEDTPKDPDTTTSVPSDSTN